MNVEPCELLGETQQDFSPMNAVKTGMHDALSTVVKYGTIAAMIAVGSIALLDEKTRDRLKKRWL